MPPTARPRADRSAAARSASALSPEHILASIRGRGQRPARRRRLLAAPAGGPADRTSGQGRGPPAPDPSRASGPSDLEPGASGCPGLRGGDRSHSIGPKAPRIRRPLAGASVWGRRRRSRGTWRRLRQRSIRRRRASAWMGSRPVAPGGHEADVRGAEHPCMVAVPARATPGPGAPEATDIRSAGPVRAWQHWARSLARAARGIGPQNRGAPLRSRDASGREIRKRSPRRTSTRGVALTSRGGRRSPPLP